MNRRTSIINDEQFEKLVDLVYNGSACRVITPNEAMGIALMIEGNCALRIGDILRLNRGSFVAEGDRIRFNLKEQKTKKMRSYEIPRPIYEVLMRYADEMDRDGEEPILQFTARGLQKKLKKCCIYLGYENISTHSFRKRSAMNVYRNSGYNIILTKKFLNHSSPAVTQRYLGIDEDEVNSVLEKSYMIPSCLKEG